MSSKTPEIKVNLLEWREVFENAPYDKDYGPPRLSDEELRKLTPQQWEDIECFSPPESKDWAVEAKKRLGISRE